MRMPPKQSIESMVSDCRIRRGVRRALQAIAVIQSRGLAPTGRRVLRQMVEADGSGTSMCHVTVALQLWRRDRLQLERSRIRSIGRWIGTCSDDGFRLVAGMVRSESRIRWWRRTELIGAAEETTWRRRYRFTATGRILDGRCRR